MVGPRCFFREPSSNRREIGWSDCSELEACDVDDYMVDLLVPYSHTVLMNLHTPPFNEYMLLNWIRKPFLSVIDPSRDIS